LVVEGEIRLDALAPACPMQGEMNNNNNNNNNNKYK
jgi:hypothetical protein